MTFKKCNVCDPDNKEHRAHFDTQKEVYECACTSPMKDTPTFVNDNVDFGTPTLDPEAEARFDEKFSYNNAPMKNRDDKGFDITPEPLCYELKSHIALEKELSRREGIQQSIEAAKKAYDYDTGSDYDPKNQGVGLAIRQIELLTPPQATPQKESI